MRLLILSILLLNGCATKKSEAPSVSTTDKVKAESVPQEVLKEFEPVPVIAAPVAPAPPVRQKRPKAAAKPRPAPSPSFSPMWKHSWSPQLDKCGFKIGEKTLWDISFIGIPAGTLSTRVLPKSVVRGRPNLHFETIGETGKVFSVARVFARGTAQAYIDVHNFVSTRFDLDLVDTNGTRKRTEIFDHDKQESYLSEVRVHKKKGRREKNTTSVLMPGSLDPAGLLYYIRCRDLAPGTTLQVRMHTEGKNREAVIRSSGIETIRTAAGRFEAIKIDAQVALVGMLKESSGKEDNDVQVWLSNDEYRRILRVRMKIKFGAIQAELASYEPGNEPI